MNINQKQIDKIDAYNILYGSTPMSSDGVHYVIDLSSKLKTVSLREFENERDKYLRAQLRILTALFIKEDVKNNLYIVLDFIGNLELYDTPTKHKQKKEYVQDTIAELLGLYGRFTNEITIEQWREFIDLVSKGASASLASKQVGIPKNTALAMDKEFGFSDKYFDRVLDDAIIAIRENVSVRQFAKIKNFKFSKARVLLANAREILKELGEIK